MRNNNKYFYKVRLENGTTLYKVIEGSRRLTLVVEFSETSRTYPGVEMRIMDDAFYMLKQNPGLLGLSVYNLEKDLEVMGFSQRTASEFELLTLVTRFSRQSAY